MTVLKFLYTDRIWLAENLDGRRQPLRTVTGIMTLQADSCKDEDYRQDEDRSRSEGIFCPWRLYIKSLVKRSLNLKCS